ncbi:MAG TPA: hypothetical protein VKB72_03110 [Steroidobacteraceae bacterium]|nr:hypothetical protein [Steroidobacteraceae bacterium]
MLTRALVVCSALALGGVVTCARSAPYTDPKLLEVPWGNYSFIRQGWRGYLETVPGTRYRDGLGVVWGQTPPQRSPAQVAAALSWAGFRRVRLEIPWGSVKWDESGLQDEAAARLSEILRALRFRHLRPLVLLNANHLQPCPVQWRELQVARATATGARTLVVNGDVSGLSASTATIMSLADGTTAGPLITSVAGASGAEPTSQLGLSKALRRALQPGEKLRVAILRYPPLYPVDTPQFADTAAGWLRYVALVAALVQKAYGSADYDVEVWNELTFGSAFLDVSNYTDKRPANAPEFLQPGGSAWELARRTAAQLKQQSPNIEVIWGFSNTTFFHVKIAELPRHFDGQSYHPYGTGRRCYADLIKGREALLLDGYVPSGCVIQPEGYAQGWQQTESLLRFLAPANRAAPAGDATAFQHFITEHGIMPAEIGISDGAAAGRAKKNFLLRAPLFWLNKGLTAFYVYDAYERDDTHWGVLRSDGTPSAGMQALHALTTQFGDATALTTPRQLSLEVTRDGPRAGVLPGDPQGDHLPQEDAAAFLPFQLTDTRFVVGAYVMTQDFPNALAPQPYRVTIHGVDGRHATVRYYSPDTDSVLPATIVATSPESITLRLAITEIPNLIEIEVRQKHGDT